jgi:hypothetical protein
MNARFSVLAIVLVLLIPISVHSQAVTTSTGRKFNPPVTSIEITGNEPTTKAYQLHFGGGGGGGEELRAIFHPASQAPYWVKTPAMEFPAFKDFTMAFASAGEFEACNYHSDPAPRAILTDPDGQQQEIAATPVTDNPAEAGCWKVNVPVTMGMPFGLYTLTLDHPQGQLRHQWGFDYPPCVSISEGSEITQSGDMTAIRLLISGLASGQVLNIYALYIDDSRAQLLSLVSVIATRQISIGDSGDALLDIRLARSAPYTLNTIFFMLAGSRGEIYNERALNLISGEAEWDQFAKDLGVTSSRPTSFPQPKYTTYDVSLINGPMTVCTQHVGEYAQVVFPAGGSARLYANYGDTSNQVGSVPVGDPVVVLEQKASLMDGHAVVWSRLRAESGIEGWAYGNQLQASNILIIPGSKLEIQQIGTSNGQALDLMLRNAPNTTADAITALKPGSQAVLIKDLASTPNWYYVQDQEGHLGYIPTAIDYQTGAPSQLADPYLQTTFPLPWVPADVSQVPIPGG